MLGWQLKKFYGYCNDSEKATEYVGTSNLSRQGFWRTESLMNPHIHHKTASKQSCCARISEEQPRCGLTTFQTRSSPHGLG